MKAADIEEIIKGEKLVSFVLGRTVMQTAKQLGCIATHTSEGLPIFADRLYVVTGSEVFEVE